MQIGSAASLEVVLGPGDVLYLPAYWFHFIVSLGPNAQCNTRSGTPPHGEADVEKCKMPIQVSEEAGVNTVKLGGAPPRHHAEAVAAVPGVPREVQLVGLGGGAEAALCERFHDRAGREGCRSPLAQAPNTCAEASGTLQSAARGEGG